MQTHQIIDKVNFFNDPDFNNTSGCLTLAQEYQLVLELERKNAALWRIANRYPCETAQQMAEEAQRAL